jgi:hypothetical protein
VRYLLVATVVGLVVGVATGGRLSQIGNRAFRLWPVLALGFVVQVVAMRSDTLGAEALLASYACLLVFALANLHLRGMAVVAIGIAANALVIGVNGGMPVRGEALLAAGLAERETLPVIEDGKHHLEEPDDRLTVLADIIPVPPLREVVSYGDLIQGVGLADVLVHLMRSRRRRRPEPEGERDEEGEAVDLDAALAPYAVEPVIDLTAEERRVAGSRA